MRCGVGRGCTTAGIGCIDCKKIFFDNLMKVLDPIREKRAAMEKDPDYVSGVLETGAARCREIARATIAAATLLDRAKASIKGSGSSLG